MALEELNTFLGLPAMIWFFACIAVAVMFVILIAVHETFIMSSFAKAARSMKRSKGLWALIQENNVLRLLHSKGSLPEGLYLIDNKWFVRPQNPYLNGNIEHNPRNAGRKPKVPKDTDTENEDDTVSDDYRNERSVDVLKKGDREALNEILQVPILEGVGKPLFVGSVNQPMLLAPQVVSHADLTRIREILPQTLTQTQLDALHTYSKLKGIKMAGKETTKLLVFAIIGAIIIGTMGLIVYLLTSPRTPAAILTLVSLFH
jgi:hypothetical protein